MDYQIAHCRFCKALSTDGSFVKYAVRSSACPECFCKHKGEAGFRALSLYQLEKFPILVAYDQSRELGQLVESIYKEKKAEAAAWERRS